MTRVKADKGGKGHGKDNGNEREDGKESGPEQEAGTCSDLAGGSQGSSQAVD